jgi:hypothetical protein
MSYAGRYDFSFTTHGTYLNYFDVKGSLIHERVGLDYVSMCFRNPIAFNELVLKPRLEAPQTHHSDTD